jgi:L-threonylcarbamoyladenylate synthase
VLDLTTPLPTLLRPGGVSLEALQAVLGEVVLGQRAAAGAVLQSPGLLDSHYAPRQPLWLVVGPAAAAHAWLRERAMVEEAAGRRVGLLLPDEDLRQLADLQADQESLGPTADLAGVASRLYAAMRALDARRPDLILARDLGDSGIGRAIGDRLRRAARRVIDV